MKKIFFSIVTLLFIGLAANAQKKLITLPDFGFNKVSSYAGPCVNGSGMCTGDVGPTGPIRPTDAIIGITQVSGTPQLVFSEAFLKNNIAYLGNGYAETKVDFSLPRSVAAAIGINYEYVVKAGRHAYSKDADGNYVMPL